MSVLYLDVEIRRIQKMLRESWPERVDEQAQQTDRAKREAEQLAAFRRNHPENGNAA